MIEMKDEDGQHRDGTEAVDFRSIGEWLRRMGQSGNWEVEGRGAGKVGENLRLEAWNLMCGERKVGKT